MAFQFTPLVFGVMLVVAVGTVAYTVWNMNSARQYSHSYKAPTLLEPGYDTKWDESDENQQRKRKRITPDPCSICLESLKNNLSTLTCKHVFHDHCIRMWLNSNKSCPICRTSSSSLL